MKVAIVQDYLCNPGGGEVILEHLIKMYPKADIYTLIYQGRWYKNSPISKQKIYTSFLQKIPFAKNNYRNLLPLFPIAIEQFDLREYDLVLSNQYIAAHGVITYPHQTHIVYTCTPCRQVWSSYFEYLDDKVIKNPIKRLIAKYFIHKFRIWDVAAANRVSKFIAISEEVRKRIELYYDKDAEVIYPPVPIKMPKDIKDTNLELPKEFYLVLSRLTKYKRLDLVIKAFQDMPNKQLVIAGTGPEEKKLKKLAKSKNSNIEFLGRVSNKNKWSLLKKAEALIYPSYEDFGITPIESQAVATPVIAFSRGGSLETVIHKETGILFNNQTAQSIKEAVLEIERREFNTIDLLNHAKKFQPQRFYKEFKNVI
jgi:glycosyltransferase involved in cell wall biosynthesis